MSQRDAVLQEALDQSYWWRLWAALKHGLPIKPVRNTIERGPAAAEVQEAAAAVVKTGLRTWLWPTVKTVGAGLVGGGVLGPLVLYAGSLLLGGDEKAELVPAVPPAAAEAESDAQAPTLNPQPAAGDLLKFLRQEGYHVPPPVEAASP